MIEPTLDAYLSAFCREGDAARSHIADTVRALADAAVKVRKAANEGALGTHFAQTRGSAHAEGDDQKDLDLLADRIFLEAAEGARVAFYASEELELVMPIAGGPGSPSPSTRWTAHPTSTPMSPSERFSASCRPPPTRSGPFSSRGAINSPPGSSSTARNWRWR